jgi:hypothetical protein
MPRAYSEDLRRRIVDDADWFRAALIEKNIMPCIPPKNNRKT